MHLPSPALPSIAMEGRENNFGAGGIPSINRGVNKSPMWNSRDQVGDSPQALAKTVC
jgi:hypothetical protein